MRRRKTAVIGVVAAVVLGAVTFGITQQVSDSGDYRLQVEMPSAEGLHTGTSVQADGVNIGQVSAITTNNGEAVVDVAVSGHDVPFHAGTTADIAWDSLIGARHLNLVPGPASNPVLPSGHLITSTINRTEIDTVLAALTPKTRAYLDSLVSRLQDSLSGGNATSMNAMLKDAGPAIGALGDVLQAIGSDGPAVQQVVTKLNSVVTELVSRQNDVRSTISNADQLTGTVAGEQDQLSSALGQLPSTLRTARTTLNQVPAAVDATIPLLNQLTPAIDQLPQLSDNLGPLLTNLKPAVAKLDPTLVAAQTLLNETPSLLGSAQAVVPGLSTTLTSASPAVAFLRPYIPELMGWLTEWGGAFSPYDSQGHYIDALINSSALSVDDNPGITVPGLSKNDDPKPGYVAGQAWTDADGSGMR